MHKRGQQEQQSLNSKIKQHNQQQQLNLPKAITPPIQNYTRNVEYC